MDTSLQSSGAIADPSKKVSPDVQVIEHLIFDVEAEQGTPTLSKARFLLVLLTLSLVLSVNGLDANVLGDAAPEISKYFRNQHISWLSTVAFLAATCVCLPFGGLYARFEPRNVLLGSLVVQAIGEALAGSASTFGVLVLGRALVGVALGNTATGAFLIVGLICESTAQRAIYLSLVTALYGVMIKVGPLVAGSFLKRSPTYWRWCFYVELPILGLTTLLLIAGCPRFMSPTRRSKLSTFNRSQVLRMLIGTFLQAGLVLTLLIPCLLGGSTLAWNSGALITCYVLSPILMALFILSEYFATDEYRLTPVLSFRSRRFSLISVVTFCTIAITFASTYFMSIHFQIVYGSTPIHAAVQLLPLVISGTVACVAVGKIAEVRGTYKSSCLVGSVFQMLGGALFVTITPRTSLWKIYIYQCILGIGAGGLAAIGNTIALQGIEKTAFARPVAWINCVLVLAAAIGVGIQGALFNQRLADALIEIVKLQPNLKDVTFGFDVLLAYLNSADAKDPILIIGRKYATYAQRDGSCLYLVIGFCSLLASLMLPNDNLFDNSVESNRY